MGRKQWAPGARGMGKGRKEQREVVRWYGTEGWAEGNGESRWVALQACGDRITGAQPVLQSLPQLLSQVQSPGYKIL